jgi:hypothetical protein
MGRTVFESLRKRLSRVRCQWSTSPEFPSTEAQKDICHCDVRFTGSITASKGRSLPSLQDASNQESFGYIDRAFASATEPGR